MPHSIDTIVSAGLCAIATAYIVWHFAFSRKAPSCETGATPKAQVIVGASLARGLAKAKRAKPD